MWFRQLILYTSMTNALKLDDPAQQYSHVHRTVCMYTSVVFVHPSPPPSPSSPQRLAVRLRLSTTSS